METRLRQLRYHVGTLLGRPRREQVLRLLPRHSVGAEVGVFRGHFTAHILRVVKPRELHLIDGWWEIFGDRFPDWGPYTEHGRLLTRDAYEEAVKTTRSAKDVCTFHVGDDCAILERFPDAYFDWVYLDTSHEYEHTMRELEILRTKVKPSGLIAGDDWHEDPRHGHHGVCRAVRQFCQEHGWEIRRVDEMAQWCVAPPGNAGAPSSADAAAKRLQPE